MITINSEKGLVRIESWSDLLERPSFCEHLDPSQHKLKAIIGRYVENPWVACGLTNCHTQHAKGYLVVTEDGLETNIGKDCGKREFGVDFEELSKIFDSLINQKESRERLWSFSFQLDRIESQLSSLISDASRVKPLLKSLKTIGSGVPDRVVKKLREMARMRNSLITLPRAATKEEIEAYEVINNRKPEIPYYVEDPIGTLRGFSSMLPENDLRDVLVVSIQQPLESFKALDIDSLDAKDLNYWSKFVSSMDSLLENAELAVRQAKQFLRLENLEPLLMLLQDSDDRRQFKSYLQRLSKE